MLPPFLLFFKGQKILAPLFTIFKIAKTYWRESIIIILALFIFYQNKSTIRWLFLIDTVPFYKQQLSETKQALEKTIDGNKQLSEAIDKNNKRVQQLKIISTELQQHNNKLQSQLHTQKQTTKKTITQTLQQHIQPTCDAAFNFLKDEINELQYQ